MTIDNAPNGPHCGRMAKPKKPASFPEGSRIAEHVNVTLGGGVKIHPTLGPRYLEILDDLKAARGLNASELIRALLWEESQRVGSQKKATGGRR